MRRVAAPGGLLFILLYLVAPSPATAQTTGSTSTTTSTVVAETLITVEPGPASQQQFRQPCSDVVVHFEERLSFILRRTGPTASALPVTSTLSGSAQPGVHFEPLSGTVTFPVGAASVTVNVVPRQNLDGRPGRPDPHRHRRHAPRPAHPSVRPDPVRQPASDSACRLRLPVQGRSVEQRPDRVDR